MRRSLLLLLVLVFAYSLSACAENIPITGPTGTLSVEDQASLLAVLQAAGATIETGDPITQDFFSIEGQTVKLNGADLQVFEYADAAAMEQDASLVAPDGGSIGTSMVTWIDPPHFYKAGRIIVLYLGSDQAILDLLNKVLGPQFAGQ
ncbi:MAG TPA: hypothetical protein VFQ13_13250 [Anaerolineales bacterium]|nr:hypothetical protein [Anaerolineales bacterium]